MYILKCNPYPSAEAVGYIYVGNHAQTVMGAYALPNLHFPSVSIHPRPALILGEYRPACSYSTAYTPYTTLAGTGTPSLLAVTAFETDLLAHLQP